MEKYSSYKDSGEKWLGEIPGHWEIRKIKYLLEESNSGIWGEDPKGDENDFVCFRVADFDYFKGILSEKNLTKRNITPNEAQKRLVKKGDLLIEKSGGGSLYPVGRVVRNNTEYKAVCSNFLHFVRTKRCVESDFLYYFLTASYINGTTMLFFNQTTGIQNLKIGEYLEQNISLPPLPEQQAIVSYLDRVTGDIDRAIAESQRMIDLLNERKQIIIQHAVTKGLNPNAKRKFSGVEWIGDVPEGWECLPLKFVFEMRNGYTPSKNDPSLWSNGSIPWYRMEDIRKSGRFLNESIQKVTQKAVNGKGVFSAGSFIMAICTASIGEHAMLIVDSLANQRFANFKIRKSLSDKFLPMYLYYYFFVIGDFCRNNANSTCFQYVDMTALKNLPIAVPKMEEQRSIVSYLDENLQSLSQAIASAERKIFLLRERKQIIINEVVTGKVKVR